MRKERLCLGTNDGYGLSVLDQIRLFKQVGFDAFFTRYDAHIKEYARFAERHGMAYQSVHASIKNADKLWGSEKIAQTVIDDWETCINDCADAGVPMVIIHAFRGIDKLGTPTINGVKNFNKIVELAKKRNVKIAVENCEGESYLKTLLDAFPDNETVGFCWDTGHEFCYGNTTSVIDGLGSRLIATHLNDNIGVTSADGKISSADDLHLLPFDGKIDWKSIAKRLVRFGYDDILTFELKKTARYADMSAEDFARECFKRASLFLDELKTIKIMERS